MPRNFVWLLTSVSFLGISLIFNQVFAGGNGVNNGGDVVFCKPSSQNHYSGLYSLDYLAQFQPLLDINNVDESLDRIEAILKTKLPELYPNFQIFRADLFNEKDFKRTHIWDQAPYGLIDIKDESLVVLVPENCRKDDQVSLIQAVIRQPPEITGFPTNKINYKYVPEVINELKKNNPLQLSFLLVHEWLWSHSEVVERNRRINYWLHSPNFDNWTRQEWVDNLNGLGFEFQVKPELPPAADNRQKSCTLRCSLSVLNILDRKNNIYDSEVHRFANSCSIKGGKMISPDNMYCDNNYKDKFYCVKETIQYFEVTKTAAGSLQASKAASEACRAHFKNLFVATNQCVDHLPEQNTYSEGPMECKSINP